MGTWVLLFDLPRLLRERFGLRRRYEVEDTLQNVENYMERRNALVHYVWPLAAMNASWAGDPLPSGLAENALT